MKHLSSMSVMLVLLAQSMTAYSQANKPGNDPVVYINFADSSSLKTVTVNKDLVLDLDKLPNKIVLIFPDEKKFKFSIGFNKEKTSDFFKVSEACVDKEQCIPLIRSHFKSGKVELIFHKNELIMVGGLIVTPRKITAGKPVIKLFKITGEDRPGVADNESEEAKKKPFPASEEPQYTIPITQQALQDALDCFCQYAGNCVEEAKEKITRSLDKQISKDLERQGVVYVAEYDAVTSAISWFVVDRKGDRYGIIDISAIRLYANSEIKIIVNGLDSVKYVLSADGEIFFMENGAKLEEVNKQLLEEFQKGPTPTTPPAPDSAAMIEEIKKTAVTLIKDSKKFPLISQIGKANQANIIDSINSDHFIANYVDSFVNKNTRTPAIHDSADLREELHTFRDSLVNIAESFSKENYDFENFALSFEKTLKARLLALDKFLEDFNTKASTSSFSAYEYLDKLNRLRQSIKSCLQIPVTENAADLKSALVHLVTHTPVSESYYTEFSQIINAIEEQYGKALDKLKYRKTYITTLQVPDADRVRIMLHGNKSSTPLIERSFNVRGGFKIDFSSGIFFSGMSSPEYVLSKSFFKYRESRDSVVIRPGSPDPVDSTMYTGEVLTASGDFIKKNKKSLTYGAGFFAHGYWRQGRPLQFGIATGLVLNNTGMVQGMLGGCAMLNAGKQRISLLAGIAVGRVTRLSASANPYVYKDDYIAFENGQTLYDNERALPRFFDTSNSNEIPTYEKWAVSYFFGLSFNFATISVGKSKSD